MEMVLQEIEKALDAKLYYLAIVLSLTLPDLCAALASPNGDSDPKKYKNWFNANLAAQFKYMNADDMWNLRNGIVHQGRGSHDKMRADRVIFTFPGGALRMHGNLTTTPGQPAQTAYSLDAEFFCRDVIEAVRKWFVANSNDPNVIANLPLLLQLRPQGVPPFVIGAPVIA